MRSFSDNAFANLFALVFDATNAGRRLNRWEVEGVEWRRERIGHSGPAYGLQCEVHTLTRTAAPAWTLLYVTEVWWGPSGKDTVRDTRWGKLVHGRMPDVVAWLKRQEVRTRG